MATTQQLILSYGTVRPAAFPDRVAAAAEAGYWGLGLTIAEYRRLAGDGWSDDEISAVLADFGVVWAELEMIAGFAAPSGPANVPQRPALRYADPDDERTAFHIADTFGTRHLQVTGAFGDVPLEPHASDAFARLCDRAADHDLLIALEFVPYTNVPDVATALTIVESAGRPNGGLCVDSWHYFLGSRGTLDEDVVRRTVMVQVNDGIDLRPDQDRMHEAIHSRLCPGEGEFDLTTLLGAMLLAHVPISVEIFSDSLTRRSTRDAATIAADATRAVLARVDGGAR